MRFDCHLSFLSCGVVAAVLLSACGPSKGTPVAPGQVGPSSVELRETGICAAVVSVTLPQKADLLFGEKHIAVLIDLDHPEAEKYVLDGAVARDPKGLVHLERVQRVIAHGPFHDLGASEWAVVGQAGAIERVVAKGAMAETPPWDKDEGPAHKHTHLNVSLTSAIGPYLSIARHVYTFRENGFFDKPYLGGFSSRDLVTGKPVVWPAKLGGDIVALINKDLASVTEERKSRGAGPLPPQTLEEGYGLFALAFGAPGTDPLTGSPPELSALTRNCCAEDGREPFLRATELVPLPLDLTSYVTFDPQARGLVRAPNDCGSVGAHDGRLVSRKADGAVEEAFAGHIDRLVAVTWLADGELDAVRALPKREPSAEDHATLAYRLYATSKWDEACDEMRKAIEKDPQNPVFLRDLGRMAPEYSAKPSVEEASLAEARRALEKALNLAKTPELQASIYYHLGHVLVRQGDRPRAANMFERSFSLAETSAAASRLRDLR